MKLPIWYIVVVGVIALGTLAHLASRPKEDCLSRGYPRHAIFGGEVYCIKTVNGTDVVVRLKAIEAEIER